MAGAGAGAQAQHGWGACGQDFGRDVFLIFLLVVVVLVEELPGVIAPGAGQGSVAENVEPVAGFEGGQGGVAAQLWAVCLFAGVWQRHGVDVRNE